MATNRTLFVWLFWLFAVAASGQTVLQVVTKTVEKTFDWRPDKLRIDAEKATIEVVGTENSTARVVAQLISKHPERAVAEADLEAMKFLIEDEKGEIFLKNYLVLPKNGAKPASNLSVKIRVELPEGCNLEIKNRFGSARVDGMTEQVRLTGEFCKTRLERLTGVVFVTSQLGDVVIVGGAPKAEIESNRADIRLDSCRGKVSINAKFAKIRVEPSAICDVEIKAENSTIDLPREPSPESQWTVSVKDGRLDFPLGGLWKKGESKERSEVFFRPSKWAFSVNVESLFGEVVFR